MRRFSICLILLAGWFASKSVASPVVSGKGFYSATVLLIRHAEKPETGTGLSPEGQQRALAYVNYFKSFTIDAKPVRISALYAAADSSESRRSRLTLQPLSRALKIAINSSYKNMNFASLVNAMRARPGGRVSVVCWHHGTMPDLVRALGGDPAKLLPKGEWPDSVYGGIIVLRYDSQGQLVEATYRNENLMPSDSE
jgi:hypothetical protein